MFILLGEILLVSGISKRIYNSVTPLLHFIPGRLMHTNIVVCTLFGAVSGSSTATAAAVGSVAYPELTRRGYDKRAVTGALAAAERLGCSFRQASRFSFTALGRRSRSDGYSLPGSCRA